MEQDSLQVLSPCSSSNGRRSRTFSSSPEFEFWMLRNPASFSQPYILTADQLFAGGVLLPTANSHHSYSIPNIDMDPLPQDVPDPGPELSTSTSLTVTLTPSKRWTDIFKKSGLNKHEDKEIGTMKKKKKKERSGLRDGGAKGASSAQLNIINIWPFSRSRSAGNGGNRPRVVTRKVSSAPCSRSNSAGELRARRRSSPAWKVRSGVAKNVDSHGGARSAKVLKLNVSMCIGYRHFKTHSNTSTSFVVSGRHTHTNNVGSCDGVRRGNTFNLRTLFSGKVF